MNNLIVVYIINSANSYLGKKPVPNPQLHFLSQTAKKIVWKSS